MRNDTIKPMETEAEIDGKGYVHFKAWHETYTKLVYAAYMSGMTEEACRRIARKWTDHILVAKDGERAIGFVGYGASRDAALSGCGEIFALYVLAEYHGQRVGYALMNAALEKLSDYRRIALWVLKGNDKAIRFYERYGFCFDGTEKEILLGTPNTELRMVFENP